MSIDIFQSISGVALSVAVICQHFLIRLMQKQVERLEEKDNK